MVNDKSHINSDLIVSYKSSTNNDVMVHTPSYITNDLMVGQIRQYILWWIPKFLSV